MRIESVRPAPLVEVGQFAGALWDLIQEYPDASLDDQSPSTRKEFVDLIRERIRFETFWAVTDSGYPDLLGGIGFRPITDISGVLHGICFAKSVHRTGLPQSAFRAASSMCSGFAASAAYGRPTTRTMRMWRAF